jgi:arylsulfatase A-like enzyme
MPQTLRNFLLSFLGVCVVAVVEGLFLLPGYSASRNGIEWLYAFVLYGSLALGLSILSSAAGVLLARITGGRWPRWLEAALNIWIVAASVGLYWMHQSPRMPRARSLFGASSSVLAALVLLVVLLFLLRRLDLWMRDSGRRLRRPVLPLTVACTLLVLMGAAAAAVWPRGASVRRSSARDDAPAVIVVLVDTLRRDHLSAFGYERETTPELERFAADCLRFGDASSGGSRTVPSVATLFSGVYPSTHGLWTQQHTLNPRLSTLAELYRRAGYRTGAFVGNGTMRPDMGFARGFDRYLPRPLPRVLARRKTALELVLLRLVRYDRGPRIDTLVPEALEWLAQPSDRPSFLYLHLMEPHSTYAPPLEYARAFLASWPERDMSRPPRLRDDADAPWRTWEELDEPVHLSAEETQAMQALYDGEILWVDHWLGRFFRALQERGIYDESIILFLSDHGEEFGEHQGWFHGRSLYEEIVGMPMLLKLPNGAAAGSSGLSVDTVDLLPTLCGLCGIEAPDYVQGQDYSMRLADSGGEPTRSFVEEPPHLYALRSGPWKIIERRRGAERSARLFDLRSDPGEHVDQGVALPDSLYRLEERLHQLIAGFEAARADLGAAAGGTVSPDTRDLLRSLGYVE